MIGYRKMVMLIVVQACVTYALSQGWLTGDQYVTVTGWTVGIIGAANVYEWSQRGKPEGGWFGKKEK